MTEAVEYISWVTSGECLGEPYKKKEGRHECHWMHPFAVTDEL